MPTKSLTIITVLALAITPSITIGKNMNTTNQLLQRADHPNFKQIDHTHFEPAIDQLMTNFKQTIDAVAKNTNYAWDNTVQPLEEASEAIERVWNVISHLNSVTNSDNIRQAFEVVLAKITDFFTEIMQDERIYTAYQAIRNSPEYATLNSAQQMVIDNTIRDFKLSGVTLPAAERIRYKQIQQQLSELSNKFSNNVLDASQGWNYPIAAKDQAKLAGLPEHTINLAKQKAAQSNNDGWVLTLDYPCYNAVMTFAHDAELRKAFYIAYSTRASDQSHLAGVATNKWDNSQVMQDILRLRAEEAELVGYKNYAEYSLATKMATDTAQVMKFLNELVDKAHAQAKTEYSQLQNFAKEKFNVADLQPWDIAYYSEHYKKALYDISEEQLRPYFPEQKVLAGMFDIAHRLFGITITPITHTDTNNIHTDGKNPDSNKNQKVETWDEQVKVFAVKDAAGNTRGMFYADLYAREYKRSGAWMADLLSRVRYKDGTMQTPAAFLVANFTPPVTGKPALLSHEEVITLFHEFGHTLHHILTKVEYFSVSGTKGVAWDAIELPSQFMENWCWEWDVIKELSAHYETKQQLPKTEFDKLYAAKNFQAALGMLRQLQFALFDFRLHLADSKDSKKTMQQILDEVRSKTSVIKVPEFNRFQHSFSHIFAGGYAAGYYSYLWAEVLSSDAFEHFKANGTFNAEIGNKFLTTILEQGGSRNAMDLFVDFIGRKPTIDALLKHSGIEQK